MQEELLREIAEEYLLPFFAGASLKQRSSPSTACDEKVALESPLGIAFKINRSDDYRLVLTRSQSFSSESKPVVKEIDVIHAFVDAISAIEGLLTGHLKSDLLSTFQRRIVAKAIRGPEHEDVILSGIDQMAQWGNRLYEGSPISAALGFRSMKVKHEYSLDDVSTHDFAAVLSNGIDTIMTFDFEGNFVGHEALPLTSNIPSYCPMRQAYIAEWTTKHDARVAITLNRLAEILVFRNQQLIFARRSGRWHFLTHDPVISQMRVPRDRALRTAIYETCLDASFARTGACIGVVSRDKRDQWKGYVNREDSLDSPISNKSKYLSQVINGRIFSKLDRRTRQELVAIDGATIIDHNGVILAVGAILKVPGGSEGGGRLAAAKQIANCGLGLKVSQDGGITGFRSGEKEAAFKLM